MLENLKIGFAMTGSFCTFSRVLKQLEALKETGADIFPIMSDISYTTDTRFGKAKDFVQKIEEITGKKIITSIKDAEPIGPKNYLDALIIAPCTGNTLSKIALAMTDTTVAMAAKATLRNQKPVIIAVSTNDGLTSSAKNIAAVLNMKNVYLVPFGQDDSKNKPTSIVAKMELIVDTTKEAVLKKQIQPVIRG